MEAVGTVETERVWSELHGSIERFVRRRVREPADADDIVQRIFLRVHRSLPTLREADRLHAWLYQTARRTIVDHYRAPARRHEVPAGDVRDVAPERLTGEVTEDESSALQELAGCVQPLLGALADADREALRLVEVEGVTQVEAARRLGLSVSGMKSRVQRARARLRDVLEACCRLELDRRGGLMAYEPRPGGSCGCEPSCESPGAQHGHDPRPGKR
jgi:RNA polymerase sigma-70 factor (ECF subfamily)